MESYEVAKTELGFVVFVDGKYYKIPDACARMSKEDLRILFDGIKSTSPIEGTVSRNDVQATILHGGPKIATQPKSVAVKPKQTASFSVVAEGDNTYQWQKDGKDIAGATSNTYETDELAAKDSGSVYTVKVKNAQGESTSQKATLTVR